MIYNSQGLKHILPSLTYVSDGCCFSNQFLPLDFLTRGERGHIGHCHETLQFRIDAILRREFHKKVISLLELNHHYLLLCNIFTTKPHICIVNYNVFLLISKEEWCCDCWGFSYRPVYCSFYKIRKKWLNLTLITKAFNHL